MQPEINILIGDSNPVTMGIMTKAALSIPDAVVGGVARSKEMLIAKMKHFEFDLVILDLDGREMGGVGAIEQIRDLFPAIMIIIVSDPDRENPDSAVKVLERGANAKSNGMESIASIIGHKK